MARLPTKDDLSGPANLRSGRAIASADTSAIGRGVQSFGRSVAGIGDDIEQQQNAVDLARAEAYKTEQFMSAENEFAYDPDYTTVGARAVQRTGQIVGDAANLIRNPAMRERWQIGAGTDAARVNDSISDRGITLKRQAETVAFDEALEANRRLYVDPATPETVRQKARADIQGAIEMGAGSGLLTPGDAATRTTKYLEDADYDLGLLAVEQGAFDGAVPTGDAPALLRTFEGFSATPYWDTNAYRVGYGSDTITKADGSVVKVTPGMTVTREDAERDLARRTKEFENTAIKQVGPDAWAAMPAPARAALTSVAYNYGSLPNNVVGAVKGGDINAVASAVAGLDDNKDRRRKEAAIIAGQSNPDWYTRLSPEQRQVINDRTTQRQQQATTAEAAQAKVAYETHKDQTALGILTGDVVSEQEILNDPMLQPGDQATLLRSLRSEQESSAGARTYLAGLGAGTAPQLNPYNSDDQALADKSFDTLMKAVTPEQQPAATVQFVTESGMVPKTVVADVRMGLNSSDPAAVSSGLQQAAALVDAAPMAVGNVANGQDIRDAAATYTELVGNQGMSVDQAAQQVIAMRDPANKAKAETLKTIWDQAVKDKQFSVNDVLGAFDTNPLPGGPSAGVTPYQEAAITSDYLMAAERALKGPANGDVNVARSMAIAEMKRTYGVSTVSGQEVVTKYPPENFYPPINGSQDYIRDLALADARSVVRGSPAPDGVPNGLFQAGNIDLAARPVVTNADGSISTVRSMSFEEDGKEILVPTVSPAGRTLTDDKAIDLYHQTGQHLGKFDTPEAANSYAESLHNAQAKYYGAGQADVANVMLVPTAETSADIRAGQPPRYNLMYQAPDGVWDTAPSLFVVDRKTLGDLSTTNSDVRAAQFALDRAYNDALASRPNAEALAGMESTPIVGMMKPKPEDIVPNYADLKARLDEATAKRDRTAGKPAVAAPTPADTSAQDAEAAFLLQQSQAFGAGGGAP